MTQTLYAELAEHYDLIIDRETGKEVEFLDSVIEGERVLDLACGNGRHTCLLEDKGYEVTGIDLSREILEVARERCGAEFVQGNLLDLSLGQRFESAILMWSTVNLFSREEVEKMFENVHSVLSPGGVFVLDSKPYPGDHREENQEVVESEEVRIEIDSVRRYQDRKRESRYEYVIEDRETGEVNLYSDRTRAWFYTGEEFREMLEDTGFQVEEVFDGYHDHRKRERMIFKVRKQE